MLVMVGIHFVEGKARINEKNDPADRDVQLGTARYERAVHAIMGYDEQADVEPALNGNDEWGEQPCLLPGKEKDRADMKRKPSSCNRTGKK